MSIRITEIASRSVRSDLESGDAQNCPAEANSSSEARIFKVEGALHLNDAELLENLCRQVSRESGCPVIIKLNDVCFVDSASAAVICRMKHENIVTIDGLNLFVRKVMELADESECPGRAKCS